jgi:hypothetical protein
LIFGWFLKEGLIGGRFFGNPLAVIFEDLFVGDHGNAVFYCLSAVIRAGK